MATTFRVLTPAEVRFLTKYSDWARQGALADKLETLFLKPTYMGTFADDAAVNASSHPGLRAGQFVPGDRYRASGISKFKTNTASSIGAATWTADS